MNCPKCNQDMELRQGVSKKTGKPWQGFKCLNPDCGHMEFIKDGPGGIKKEIRSSFSPDLTVKPNCDDVKVKSMILAYAKDLVVAQAQSSMNPPDMAMETIAVFNKLWVAYKDAK
jgi:hypothetical protein